MFFDEKPQTLVVSLNGHEHIVARAPLGLHITLSQLAHSALSPEVVRQYLKLCGCYEECSGIEMILVFLQLVQFNSVHTEIPFVLKGVSSDKKDPWDYDGHWAVAWVYSLAHNLGWSRAEILQLDIDEAMAYIQEIALQEQFNKELDYSLSQNCFETDSKGTSTFKPLERPVWMQLRQPRKIPVQIVDVPAGLITSPDQLIPSS